MELEEHIKKHKELHKCFDELMADFLKHTGNLPSQTNLMELGEWSNKQTKNPTPDKR